MLAPKLNTFFFKILYTTYKCLWDAVKVQDSFPSLPLPCGALVSMVSTQLQILKCPQDQLRFRVQPQTMPHTSHRISLSQMIMISST